MYATGSHGDGGVSHIGSSTLPASRPLCIPVRFQPLGCVPSSARWMGGTGALAAAASALPSPLDDDTGDASGTPMASVRYEMGDACVADAEASGGPPSAPPPADAASTTSPSPAHRTWLWPVIGALVLVLVLFGGGAAWMAWQKRQRAQTVGGALVAASTRTGDALPGAVDAPLGTVPPPSVAPMSPLPQASVYSAQDQSFVGQPLSVPLDPSIHTGAAQPAPWAPAAGAAAQWSQPLAQPAIFMGSPTQQYQQPQQQQQQRYRGHTVAPAVGQGQARGTYVMVERPPLRMRNVTAATRRAATYSDDEDDDEDGGRDNSDRGNDRHNARRASAQSRGVSRSDSWTRRAPSHARQMVASPQESHYGENPTAHSRGDVDGDAMRPHPAGPNGADNDRNDDDDDSLVGGVADYWADAERARQTYFASPQERAAHAMSLGPRAYSPDGTPMPLRG